MVLVFQVNYSPFWYLAAIISKQLRESPISKAKTKDFLPFVEPTL
jgi:hypothetical protein